MKTREGIAHQGTTVLTLYNFAKLTADKCLRLGIKQQKYFSFYIHNFYKLLCKWWRWKVLYR